MVELRRTVRFCINPTDGAGGRGGTPETGLNGFAGTPPMQGLGRYYELDIACAGEPDAASGYLISIKDVDKAARASAIPLIARACSERPRIEPSAMMSELVRALAAALPVELRALRWRLTPTYSVEMNAADKQTVVLRQRFDFAAAHRLHVPGMSEEENRRIFGRCNNPSGHGHNYMIEPAVACRVGASGDRAAGFTLADLERVTHETLIDPFDHKHLNLDTAPFGPGAGLNPSVENIARVFYDLLSEAIGRHPGGGASLRSITVWETDRTSCTFPG